MDLNDQRAPELQDIHIQSPTLRGMKVPRPRTYDSDGSGTRYALPDLRPAAEAFDSFVNVVGQVVLVILGSVVAFAVFALVISVVSIDRFMFGLLWLFVAMIALTVLWMVVTIGAYGIHFARLGLARVLIGLARLLVGLARAIAGGAAAVAGVLRPVPGAALAASNVVGRVLISPILWFAMTVRGAAFLAKELALLGANRRLAEVPDHGDGRRASQTASSLLTAERLGALVTSRVHSVTKGQVASSARQNLVDAAAGRSAALTPQPGDREVRRVRLDPNMLAGIFALSGQFKFEVSEFAGGVHSSTNSLHYRGRAADISRVRDPSTGEFLQVSRFYVGAGTPADRATMPTVIRDFIEAAQAPPHRMRVLSPWSTPPDRVLHIETIAPVSSSPR